MGVKLKTHTKVLLAGVILTVASAAAWQLGVKDLVAGGGNETETVAANTNNDNDTPQKEGGGIFGFLGGGGATAAEAAPSGALGSPGNPLKVSIVSFHGYAPALVANGGSLKTQPGSVFAKNGVNVEFVIQDDIPPLPAVFESGAAHCSWRTSDFFAQEHPSLRANGLDAKAIMVVDNTRGADAIISRDPSVTSIEDLPGKSVGLVQFTPSDGMFIDAVNNSSLSGRKKKQIEVKYINGGTPEVLSAFQAGEIDAAVLWDPDLSLALKSTPGSKVIYSTAVATNLIYDVIVCDTRVLDKPENENVFQGFVAGWMEGVTVAENNEAQALAALKSTEDFFAQLAKSEGDSFVTGLFDTLLWTGLEDNARILGRAGGTNHYERVYEQFDNIYRGAGYTTSDKPKIAPNQSFDYRFIDTLLDQNALAKAEATKPEFVFTAAERDTVAKTASTRSVVTKPVSINFDTGKAKLKKRSASTIDDEVVPLIDSMGNAYFEVSGNTDSTGGAQGNKALSLRRAQTVVDYLVSEWEIDPDRLIVVGNGEEAPICDERNPDSEGVDLAECRAMNRATRVRVLSR